MNWAEQPAGNVFAGAISWLQGALLGTIATTVAVIAVAAVGFLLMAGRIDVRRGAQVILGCFILFGASTIAAGIVGLAGDKGPSANEGLPPQAPALAGPWQAQGLKAAPYDPYAGAALPTR